MDILMMTAYSILLIVFSSYEVWCLEEPHQEIYLQPRNFNPHPYEVVASRRTSPDTGPILFPPSPPPETEGSNFIKVDNSQHPVDSHPYPKLVRKHKYRNPGRHQEFESQIDPQISKSLAGHAKKVLGHSNYEDYDGSSLNEQKNYAFSYKVVDHLTGDDFSHTQSQNEKATSGEYRVKLPDGRVQIVSYTADKNGYKADVKYQEGDVSEREPQQRSNVGAVGVSKFGSYGRGDGRYSFEREGIELRLKTTPSTPIHENHIEDYDYEQGDGRVDQAQVSKGSPRLFFAVTQPTYQAYQPTQTSHISNRIQQYSNLDYVDASQSQSHQNQPQSSHRFQIIPHNKVQIVNQGAPGFSSTVAPTYLDNPAIILSTLAPQLSDDYQHVFLKSINGAYGRK
ncbi:uncharacterized protein LOC123672779 isoform X2 [Harmonia axyridis]|uniref:uncharacterized protein LOC123672779 isoform X2 n=1 Tax=Harmonia axyridis TaxID=115357 RepID=UPI001E2769FD|nr:uncharacterized protein LOC123672779 isoform X2 [Harmonia axyridis]